MCEWTPPYETSPSRWTFPPRSRARRNAETSASFVANDAVRDRPVHALEVLQQDAARSDREVPDLRVAHLAVRQADGLSRRRERRVRVAGPERVEDGRVGQVDRISGPGRRQSPAVEDDEDDRPQATASAPARQIASNDVRVERRPADEGPVHVGKGEERGRVLGLDRAAVEHRRVVRAT